jgi:hypothetical protein
VKRNPRKTAENKADDAWSCVVKASAGWHCEYCGKTTSLQSHHIFSRSDRSVRWNIDNGVCLCASHHTLGNKSFHKAPADMIEWIKEKRGAEWWEHLRASRQVITKWEVYQLEEIARYFRNKAAELQLRNGASA